MQTIYFFITCVYGTDTTSGYETTHEFTRLGYRMVHWVHPRPSHIKYLSLTTQTSVPKTTGTKSGNSSRCFENLVSSRVDEDKIILKDPGISNRFDHFKLLFGGIGSFTFMIHMKCKK